MRGRARLMEVLQQRAGNLKIKTLCFYCCSVAKSYLTLCKSMDCIIPGFPVYYHSWSLLKFMSIELVMLSNHLILCCPLFLLPSDFPSIKLFSSESAFWIRWVKYWSFNFSLPMNIQGWLPLELTGLISLQFKGLSRVFFNTTVWEQFFGTQPSLWSNYHIRA